MSRPYQAPEETMRALKERTLGGAYPGVVTVRDFDRGVIETMGATTLTSIPGSPREAYYLKLSGIDLADAGLPGIPVVFSYPEDVYEKYKIPIVLVRRDSIDPALERWHPGMVTYCIPGVGALPVQGQGGALGYPRVLEQQQAVPFDLSYTILIEARHRGVPGGQRNQVLRILQHVMSVYQPYSYVAVTDSEGDVRTYDAFMDGVTTEDEVFDVADRTLGFSLSLRVEGELDLFEPFERQTVTSVGMNVEQK